MDKNRLGYSDKGDHGMPGTGFSKRVAFVTKTRTGRYQLDVRDVWGSNQGSLEEHGRIERVFRAATLDELMRVGIAEIRQDGEWAGAPEIVAQLVAAIREACFEAEDAE